MNKYVVTNEFQDKFTKVYYPKGSEFETEDAERAAFLLENGFLGDQVKVELMDEVSPEENQKTKEKPKDKKAQLKPLKSSSKE